MFPIVQATKHGYQKTSYCWTGRKNVYIKSDKSVACKNFQQRTDNFNSTINNKED